MYVNPQRTKATLFNRTAKVREQGIDHLEEKKGINRNDRALSLK